MGELSSFRYLPGHPACFGRPEHSFLWVLYFFSSSNLDVTFSSILFSVSYLISTDQPGLALLLIMITTHPEYYLRRPLPPSGPVMHIYGVRTSTAVQSSSDLIPLQLPPFCKPTDGWKPVKDLLRAVLAKHGLCHAESGKPGMVHNTTDYDVQSRRERIWAQCNLKSTDAAKCAFGKCTAYWSGCIITA